MAERDLVLGAYFTGKAHPQHGEKVRPADFNYIADWYHSLMRLGLSCVVVHDGLPEEFIHRYTAEYPRFFRPHPDFSPRFVRHDLGGLNAADARFFAFRDELRQSDCQYALMTDVSDVWLGRDPFRFMRHRPAWQYVNWGGLRLLPGLSGLSGWVMDQVRALSRRREYRYFIGGETRRIGDNPWMVKNLRRLYGREFPELADKPVLNCGVMGGRREDMLELLDELCAELLQNPHPDKLVDMAALNRILHAKPACEVLTNHSFNSPFRWHLKGRGWVVWHK